MTPAQKLDDAFHFYADLNGDQFGSCDYLGARDYRDDGFALAERIAGLSEDEQDAAIEAATENCTESEAALIAAAARFRLSDYDNIRPERAEEFARHAEDALYAALDALAMARLSVAAEADWKAVA